MKILLLSSLLRIITIFKRDALPPSQNNCRGIKAPIHINIALILDGQPLIDDALHGRI
jgi:hypothetical protein